MRVLLVMVIWMVPLFPLSLTAGCGDGGDQPPEGAVSVAGLLADPVYEQEITIYGEVRDLGELLCPCFTLADDDAFLVVWYDLMVEEDGSTRPAVSVENIDNGDEVVVTGELRRPGTEAAIHNFWASQIAQVD